VTKKEMAMVDSFINDMIKSNVPVKSISLPTKSRYKDSTWTGIMPTWKVMRAVVKLVMRLKRKTK